MSIPTPTVLTTEEAAYRRGIIDTLKLLTDYSTEPGDVAHFELKEFGEFVERHRERPGPFQPCDLFLEWVEEQPGMEEAVAP